MFISQIQLQRSLDSLRSIHPFYAITFLVCKRAGLPIDRAVHLPITDHENKFLEDFYDPSPQSNYFYRVSRLSSHDRHWVPKHKYASSTLQSIRTRGHFSTAFIHEKNSDLWGWSKEYLHTLEAGLSLNGPPFRGKCVPAFDLAVWLSRGINWPSDVEPKHLLKAFLTNFRITKEEQSIFDMSIERSLTPVSMFQDIPLGWAELREVIGSPPDAKAEQGGGLSLLTIQGVGPAKRKLSLEPADRLTLVTGDNGLGKTFLLECAWWALTGQWAGLPALPFEKNSNAPELTFQISAGSRPKTKTSVRFDSKTQTWSVPRMRPTIPGLIVYARVDGSFAVWDPAKPLQSANSVSPSNSFVDLVFSKDDVWNGRTPSIEGLLRDWVKWQSSPQKYPFEMLKRVLARMSPPDLGVLEPGEPMRLPNESREIPTLKHPFGIVPVTHASAGVRRILGLVYLIVWAWNEHNVFSRMSDRAPQDRMVILIDEVEAHLHPKWQRAILPATLDIREELSADLQVQMIVATHSPMTMASMEPFFDEKKDKLFHLDLRNGDVELKEQPFVRHGSIGAWLTSEVFELRHARSREAERSIERAKELQLSKKASKEDVAILSRELMKYLASDDEFWPRWVFFAEKHGVKL